MREHEQSPELENCLKLLKVERDEQRLAGLLLVPKFCNKDDQASILRVYNAVSVRFLNRLLRTMLAAFCRVPDIASSKDMLLKIPLFLEILSTSSYLMEVSMRLMQLLLTKLSPDNVNALYALETSTTLHALIVSESMIRILGEGWLIGPMNLPDIQDTIPADQCLLLVLESSRVEVAVLLNELAYLKYEASKSSSSSAEDICSKQWNLIIKWISTIDEDEGSIVGESTFTKLITRLNETTGVVLEYLQDAKENGQRKGDDLFASIRIVGSYLAEAPLACKEKVWELLEYMLLVEGEGEPRPFYSACFLLPLLCQLTIKNDGCKDLPEHIKEAADLHQIIIA
ncbi:Neurochondrin, partial [Dillenia turbinata]